MKIIHSIVIVAAIATVHSYEARAQVDVGIRVGVPTVVVEPPAAYIATVEPEYYEGRPVYFYNNNWYYRDHGRWSYYRAEPRYLHERRGRWEHRGQAHWGYQRPGYVRPVERRGYRPEPARYHYHR